MDRFNSVKRFLEGVQTSPPAPDEAIESLVESTPFDWPTDYLDCLRWSNGLEGYVGGGGYLWLWKAGEVFPLNEAYGADELFPDVHLFGTDAAATGYGFYPDSENPCRVVSVKLAAMHPEYAETVAPDFSAFVHYLATEIDDRGEGKWMDDKPPEWLREKVIHEKHPIVLGGDPEDPNNRVVLPRQDQPRATYFFARLIHRIRKDTGKDRE